MSRVQAGRRVWIRTSPTRAMVLCCHCACTTMPDFHVELNTQLKAPEGPYSVVLPICKSCIDNGCHIIVRDARQKAAAKQASLEARHARKVSRQERTLVEEA